MKTNVVKADCKILVMDDEEFLRLLSAEYLRKLGYKVITAADGREAIELYKNARKERKPFDVVIMDLTIPGGLGGRETIAKLRKIDPGVKAVITSGHLSDPIMADYKNFGFRAVIKKPFNINDLDRILSKIIH